MVNEKRLTNLKQVAAAQTLEILDERPGTEADLALGHNLVPSPTMKIACDSLTATFKHELYGKAGQGFDLLLGSTMLNLSLEPSGLIFVEFNRAHSIKWEGQKYRGSSHSNILPVVSFWFDKEKMWYPVGSAVNSPYFRSYVKFHDQMNIAKITRPEEQRAMAYCCETWGRKILEEKWSESAMDISPL